MLRTLVLLVGFAVALPVWAVEEGDVVVIKQDADLKDSGKKVGAVKTGDVLKVHEVRGAWVQVGEKVRGWVRAENVSTQDDAVAHVSKLLEEKPGDVKLLITRARMYLSAERYEAAELDLAEAQRLDPAGAEPLYYLAVLDQQRGNADVALKHIDKAIELDGENHRYYALRAKLHHRQRDIASATKDYEKVIALGGGDAETYNALAWWYATNPDMASRNGGLSVKYALKACELTHYHNFMHVDTLAAAYAEFNDFTKAVMWQEEAVRLCNVPSEKAACESRLKQYRLQQPYRETPR